MPPPPLASGGYRYSLGVAHAVQHHLPSTARRVAVVKELVKHPVVHLGGQVAHEQRVHLSKPGGGREEEETSEETSWLPPPPPLRQHLDSPDVLLPKGGAV